MPRPGPRPYECVRRAWHSDRHQPMRGSIIQQIFSVVSEAHTSATRKNREWQEKLPIVALKAEEIMYSKADSEAEYMNLDTLWDRLNDAIDTIIRRDESTETEQSLHPCIEAALVLGCVPVRASRSQRRNNQRSYLTPRAQKPPPPVASAAPTVQDKINNGRPTFQPSKPSGCHSSIQRPSLANQASSSSKPDSHRTAQNTNPIPPQNVPILHKNSLQSLLTSAPFVKNSDMKFGSFYALPFGTHFQTVDPCFSFQMQQNLSSGNVIVGTPIGWSPAEAARIDTTRNLFPGESVRNAANKLMLANREDSSEKASEMGCDLSLRMGPFTDSKHFARETKDGDPSSCQEGSRFPGSSSQNQAFCFFPRNNAYHPSDPCPSKRAAEGEVQDVNAALRKRKAPILDDDEGSAINWQPKPLSDGFPSRIRSPGL
ncbi:hypothetical protein Nepgr_022396 [Nepenthes gracilis]|uniref:Histone acetyltransferase n=1 Tax=Nepenthes gracilis TaxID=150966 RepID=A0AAD3SZF9_NEPGR|nr:hypothetical protein Nepgr_022396 [Nepenthes gracilis]